MAEPPPPANAPGCLNCGAPGNAAYCPACGQSTSNPRRDLGALLGELFGSLFSFDGRVWRTLMPLFFRPGALTRDWIEGRRARSMPPLRVFLFFSILLLVLLQYRSSATDLLLGEKDSASVIQIESTPAPSGDPAQDRAEFDFPLPPFWPFTLLRARLQEQEDRFNRFTEQEQAYLLAQRAMELAPIALLMLLPLMGCFLKLWWMRTGSFFLDHLVLLMHAYAFTCGLVVLLAVLPLPTWVTALTLTLGVPIHFHLAMRRTYQRGFWRTLGATLMGGFTTVFAAILVVILLIPYGLLTF